jgi:pimeloyl-ACP methyl ester carboxylesterase
MTITTTQHGVQINYDTFGNSGNPPLLLIQGLGAQMIGWHPELCQKIADRGFHVIRFDNRDTGLSQHFPDEPYTLADMAEDAAGLLASLDIPTAHVVGQSMGGMIAQQLTFDHPDRVSTLAIIYSAPSTEYITGTEEMKERMELPRARNREEAVTNYIFNEAPCASTAYEQDTTWLSELGGEMYDRDYDPDGIQRQADAMNRSPQRTARLTEIKVPTTLIHGDSDRLISYEASVLMHELIAGSTLTVFPGMGHELPRAVWEDILDLIQETTSKAELTATQIP